MEKVKLIVNEEFSGKRLLEDVLVSAFRTKVVVLMVVKESVILKLTKWFEDAPEKNRIGRLEMAT